MSDNEVAASALKKLRVCDVNIGAWISSAEADALLALVAERDALQLALNSIEEIADYRGDPMSQTDRIGQIGDIARGAVSRTAATA